MVCGMGVSHFVFRRGDGNHVGAGTTRSGLARRTNETSYSAWSAPVGQNLSLGRDPTLAKLADLDGIGCGPVPLVGDADMVTIDWASRDRSEFLDLLPHLPGKHLSGAGSQDPERKRP